jgi:hypothetical protein
MSVGILRLCPMLRFRFDPRDDPSQGYGWCTPGGVREGEDMSAAAARQPATTPGTAG